MTGRPTRIQRPSMSVSDRMIDPSSSRVVRLVRDGIEHRDDLAVDVERVRDVDVAAEHAADALAHDALAVSGRAVEEHRLARRDRGPELIEHFGLDDQMGERACHALAIDVAGLRAQRAHVRRRTAPSGTGAGPT